MYKERSVKYDNLRTYILNNIYTSRTYVVYRTITIRYGTVVYSMAQLEA